MTFDKEIFFKLSKIQSANPLRNQNNRSGMKFKEIKIFHLFLMFTKLVVFFVDRSFKYDFAGKF